MKAINPNEIKDNFIELIGKEWMLVSAGDKEKFNMMTASWGGVGVLWNRPVVFAFIRPERYTREFIDAKNEFTITFLGPEHRKAHSICGSKSGREIDKVAATGLTHRSLRRLVILYSRKLALRWNVKWSISPRSRRLSF